jgi:hypothetical protein
MTGPHVVTSVQQRLMHAPNAQGMHPEAARVLAMRGVDPQDFSQRATTRSAHVDVGALSGFTLGQRFDARAPSPAHFAQSQGGADPRVQRFLHGLGTTEYTKVRAKYQQCFGLDPGDAVVEELLTQAAVEWKNFDTIHARVCPLQTEALVAGRYLEYDRAGQRQVVDSRIGPDGAVRRVSRRVSSRSFSTDPRALEGSINRLAQAVSPTLNKLSSETEFVMGMHDREMERDVAAALGDPASYPASNIVTLGSSFRWNGGAAAIPVQNVLDLLLAIPAYVNHCVFSDLAWGAAQVNTQLQHILLGRFRATDGVLSPAEFAQFFGVENVWITKHLIEEGGTVRRTWSETDAWFGHVNPARDEPTTARRFRTALPGGPQGVHVRTYFDPRGPMGSDNVVVTRQDSGVVFVGPDFGGLIRGVRQTGP